VTRYRTIVADPPWDHSDGTGMTLTVGMSSRCHPDAGTRTVPYAVMSLDRRSRDARASCRVQAA
jgi:hypothetical protein